MKTLFRMTAAVLLLVTMLFVSLPGSAVAADMTITVSPGPVTKFQTGKTKKDADKAVQAAKVQAEKAKTDEGKRLANQLLNQAEINAKVAGNLLEAVNADEKINLDDVTQCDLITNDVEKAAKALAENETGKAGKLIIKEIEKREKKRKKREEEKKRKEWEEDEARREAADAAGKNQSLTEKDILEQEEKIVEEIKDKKEDKKEDEKEDEKEKGEQECVKQCVPMASPSSPSCSFWCEMWCRIRDGFEFKFSIGCSSNR